MALYITEGEVSRLLTMDIALEAVEDGFMHLSRGSAFNFPRHRLPTGQGSYNFMSASAPGLGVMGTKSYSVGGGSSHFYVHLYDSSSGRLLAVIEASGMGQTRTGAASGVATKYMAREDADSLGVIGTGYQASAQLEAICKVRNIKSVRVYSRSRDKRSLFAESMSLHLETPVTAVDSAQACVSESSIVVAITSAKSPVLEGEWLSAGTHINAAGNNHWMKQEVDYAVVQRASVIVADDVEGAKVECGDLVYPVDRGITTWDHVRNLSDVVAGVVDGRPHSDDITLFESQGLAIEDLAVGIRVYNMAKEQGLGKEVSSPS